MHDDGKTFAEISRKLDIPRQTVSCNYYQMCKTQDPYYRKSRSGHHANSLNMTFVGLIMWLPMGKPVMVQMFNATYSLM